MTYVYIDVLFSLQLDRQAMQYLLRLTRALTGSAGSWWVLMGSDELWPVLVSSDYLCRAPTGLGGALPSFGES
jgi:hypothetical protein